MGERDRTESILDCGASPPPRALVNEDAAALLAFLDEMTPRVQAAVTAEELRRRCQGTGFSIAKYAVRGEVQLNRIICDLLEPRGPHGQGTLFLQIFLNLFLPDLLVGELQDWKVRVNHPTAHGRYVDIAMLRKNEIAIYIESKPWAVESDGQLEEYASDLLSLSCAQMRFLFLPGISDRDPRTLTQRTLDLLGKQFVRVPFQHCEAAPSIVGWLEKCADACEADNVRIFIRDLADYLRRQFPSFEAQHMSEDPFVKEMLPIVRGNQSYMATVFKVAHLADELRTNVTVAFFQNLASQLLKTRPGWVVKNDFNDMNPGERHFSLRFPSWPEVWSICMERQSAFQEYCIGFRCPPDATDPVNGDKGNDHLIIRGALEQPLRAIGNVQKSEWWPAYCCLPEPFYPIWKDETFLFMSGSSMPDGRTALETFAGWFESLANAIESKIGEIQSGRIRGTND